MRKEEGGGRKEGEGGGGGRRNPPSSFLLPPSSHALFIALAALLPAPLQPQRGEAAADGSPAPLSRFLERKAESLLRDHLPCLGCHTLNGEGGRIGPDLGTVRERRSAAYVAAIIADPQRVVPGSAMPRTPMPDATRDLVTRYLATRPGTAAGPAPAPDAVSATPAAPRSGSALYAAHCAACHGATGRGDGPNAAALPVKPAPHASSEAMSRRPDDSLFDTIHGGGAIMNRSPRMPAYGATLSREEIRSLVGHIRELCRCRGPRWSTDRGRPGARR
jgi:mono/diheme cytochrome c family protein